MTPRRPVVDAAAWTETRRILCVRTDGIGDVLMTAPAIRALRAVGPPDRTITLLGSPQGLEAAELLDDVDATIVCRAPWAGVSAAGAASDDAATVDALRAGGFDAAVIFTVHTQSALPAATWCRLAGIPRVLAHSRENPYALVSDWVPEPETHGPTRHEVVRQLELVAHVGASSLGAVRFTPGVEDLERASTALRVAGVDTSHRWVALHPGASAPSRRYPAERFARAADMLIDRGWQVLLGGGRYDAAAVEGVRAAMRRTAAILAVPPTLRDLATVIALADVLVGNNSGPAHVAALVGTPVVDLYALTNVQHAPWGVPHRLLFRDVPCRGCLRSVCPEGHHLCLRGVDPGTVVDAVHDLVGRADEPTATERGAPPRALAAT